MDNFDEGLRCQDVHAGLRNIDPNAGILTPLADTQKIGMTASLASLIRGQDVITDAQALRAVAAEQLDVSAFAYNDVVDSLAELGFVSNIKRSSGKIVSFNETVPLYGDLYSQLGSYWHDSKPSELEQQVVLMVDALADSPLPVEELADRLGLDSADMPQLLEVTQESELIKLVDVTGSGKLAYSPFLAFEHPELISEMVSEHGGSELAESFAIVRGEQGIPMSKAGAVLADAVARGLLMAPSVDIAGGGKESFVTLLYTVDQQLLKERKPVLDKALAVVACLRCGQYFGGATDLEAAALVRVIDKLLDPNRGFLKPHSSHKRQYALLHGMGLIRFEADLRPGGTWVTPTFIDSDDNRAAMTLARDLLVHGESMKGRVGDDQARRALALGSPYTSPMQTIGRFREKKTTNNKQWEKVIDAAFGRSQL